MVTPNTPVEPPMTAAVAGVPAGRDLTATTRTIGDTIRFAVVGSVEIAPATLTRWLALHALVLGPALTPLTALAWRWTRPERGRTIA